MCLAPRKPLCVCACAYYIGRISILFCLSFLHLPPCLFRKFSTLFGNCSLLLPWKGMKNNKGERKWLNCFFNYLLSSFFFFLIFYSFIHFFFVACFSIPFLFCFCFCFCDFCLAFFTYQLIHASLQTLFAKHSATVFFFPLLHLFIHRSLYFDISFFKVFISFCVFFFFFLYLFSFFITWKDSNLSFFLF